MCGGLHTAFVKDRDGALMVAKEERQIETGEREACCIREVRLLELRSALENIPTYEAYGLVAMEKGKLIMIMTRGLNDGVGGKGS